MEKDWGQNDVCSCKFMPQQQVHSPTLGVVKTQTLGPEPSRNSPARWGCQLEIHITQWLGRKDGCL